MSHTLLQLAALREFLLCSIGRRDPGRAWWTLQRREMGMRVINYHQQKDGDKLELYTIYCTQYMLCFSHLCVWDNLLHCKKSNILNISWSSVESKVYI